MSLIVKNVKEGKYRLLVSDYLGRVVSKSNVTVSGDTSEVNVSGPFASGVYYVQLVGGMVKTSTKVLVKKVVD